LPRVDPRSVSELDTRHFGARRPKPNQLHGAAVPA
jgi:hypothetical protein